MRRIILGFVIGVVVASAASAQHGWVGTGTELRSSVGAYIPTGAQRSDFKTATMVGLQAAQEISSNLHVLASLGWTHGHNKFQPFSDDRTFIWQYDAGVELNAVRELENDWLWRPLLGAGVGARTYQYKAANTGSNTCTAGYVSTGTEFQRNVMAARLEVRDYLNCFESPMTGKKSTRNDIGLTLGLVYHLR